MSFFCNPKRTKSLLSLFSYKPGQRTTTQQVQEILNAPRSLPNLKPDQNLNQDHTAANMLIDEIIIFGPDGKILPIKDRHFRLQPVIGRMQYYSQLPLEAILLLPSNTSRHGIELFMELHRRAAVHFHLGQSRYKWDCVTDEVDEGGQNSQHERARILMAYDCKWVSGTVNPVPKWFQHSPEEGEEPAYIAVGRAQKELMERHRDIAAEASGTDGERIPPRNPARKLLQVPRMSRHIHK